MRDASASVSKYYKVRRVASIYLEHFQQPRPSRDDH